MRSSYYRAQKQQIISGGVEAEKNQRDTMRAWEFFVDHGYASNDPNNSVRSEIIASWKRCADSGVSAFSNATPQIVTENVITRLRSKSQSLCDAAGPAFDKLAPLLSGTGAILILTDKSGTVIEAIGDSNTLDAGREIQLEVGGVWDERVIGTNGIGTALSTGKPTYVHASEHFCQGIKSWTCVGVPVIDALDRSIIGVVNLSGPSNIFRPHNVALVVSTAREIELTLAEQHREEHTVLLEGFIGIPRKSDTDDTILILNSAGKIVFSRNTGNLIRNDCCNFRVGTKLLELLPEMSVGDLASALPSVLPIKDIDLIKAGGETQGIALILRDKPVIEARSRQTSISIKPRTGVSEDEVVIVGECPKMLEAVRFARRAAEMKVPVLIQGETGVGKELFARLIHSHFTAKTTPYVVVNCATISAELIRSELFGHAADTYSGVSCEGKLGKFEQANGGVLCLDEICDMPPELQTYLLRTLEQRAVYRIGSDIRRAIDVQLIAMTNRNISQDIESGRFRRDLFYRIGTIVIEVPPLRERGQDIARLIEHYNHKLSAKYDHKALEFNTAAIALLQQYRWPGNVRELRNVVEKLYLLDCNRALSISDLPDDIVSSAQKHPFFSDDTSAPIELPMDLDGVESIAIQRSIDLAGGNLTKAAGSLGISRPTLYRKIRQFGLTRHK